MTALELDKGTVLEILVTRFSRDELRGVCFDLGISQDELDGKTLELFAMELIEYARRRDMNGDLMRTITQHRPQAWREMEFKTRPMLMPSPPPIPKSAVKTGYAPTFGYMGNSLFSLQRLLLAQSALMIILLLAVLIMVSR